MPCVPCQGREPAVHPSVYIAGGAQVIGDVDLAEDVNIWFNAVLRGDINRITVGARTNIQDGAVVHVTQALPAVIGADVTVGHQAIVHACTVEDCCLIGMGSVVLDGAVVGTGSLVAAGAVVLQGARIPPGSLAAGVPAKVLRSLTAEEREALRTSAADYVGFARRFRE